MGRIAAISASLLVVVAGLMAPHVATARASHIGSVTVKKKCHIKKVHGKKKVCKKPATKATATPGPTHTVRSTPAFPGAPPGAFMAGVSTSVTIPATVLRSERPRTRDVNDHTVPGGTPIGPVDYQTGLKGPIPGVPGEYYKTIVNLTISIADGRGFTEDQKVCFRDRNGNLLRTSLFLPGDGHLCADVKSLTPYPQPNLPHATTLTFHDVRIPEQLTAVNAIALVTCDELAVPVMTDTSLARGELFSFSLNTPGNYIPYAGQVGEVDTQNGLAYLPIDGFLPEYNPLTDGFRPYQLLSPGSLLQFFPAEPQPTITIGSNTVEIKAIVNDKLWIWPKFAGVRVEYLRLPIKSTLKKPELSFGSPADVGTWIKTNGNPQSLQDIVIDVGPSAVFDLVPDIMPLELTDTAGNVLLDTQAVVTRTQHCLLTRTTSSDPNSRTRDACGTPTPVPTATSPPLFSYSFAGLSVSWTWQSPPSKSPQIPPGQVAGTACGTDPVTAPWSGTLTYYVQAPVAWTANFSANNPAIISQPYDASTGSTIGTMTISLRLVPGPNPHMQLLAEGTGDALITSINPADVAIQATPVSSCS